MSSRLSALSFVALTMGLTLAVTPQVTLAQLPLEADGTLGNETSTVIPLQPGDFQIGGGAQRGSNLFHSFREFNVNDGGSVYFQNPAAIRTIFSRVTGGNASNILGTLGVLGNADLFLLNPNGIIFGENARLDVAGSFFASTANQFQFPDGTSFSAVNPTAPPLLTLNITPGLQYGANPPVGDIVNRGNLYAVQNLTLSGNNLDLQGQLWSGGDLTLYARDTLQIRDGVLSPFIAAAQGQLLAQGDRTIDIFALNHPNSGLWSAGDMVLRSPNPVGGDAHYYSGGNFRIEQLDQSLGTLYSPNDPIIRSLGDVSFEAYQGNSLQIIAAGDVTISNYVQILGPDPTEPQLDAPLFTLSDGSSFPIFGTLEPTLDIRAGVAPGVIGVNQLPASGEFFNTLVLTPPPVDSANIEVGTILLGLVASADLPPDFLQGRVLLTNRYAANPALSGNIRIYDTQTNLANNPDLNGVAIRAESQEGGGFVAIDSRGDIAIEGRINANAVPTGTTPEGRFIYTADGGNVWLLANGSIDLRPNPDTGVANTVNSSGRLGGSITALSRGGNITLVGAGPDQLAGFASISFGDVAPGGLDRGGDISLTAERGNIRLQNGASVATSTYGVADAGNILLRTGGTGQIEVSGESQVRGLVEQGGNGRSANITIETGSLIVNQSQIGGGLFREVTTDIIDPVTGDILVPAGPGGRGISGTITITAADSVILQGITADGFSSGIFSASGRGASGPAGDIFITAGNRVAITDGAAISSLSANPSRGGDVTIETNNFQVSRGGRVVSISREAGRAGTVRIQASNRIRIAGEDPNFQNRLDRINNYLQNDPFGQNDTQEDILGVREDEVISLASSGLFVNASEAASAGNILLTGRFIEIADHAEISSATSGSGNAGNIALTALRDITLTEQAQLSSNTYGSGNAGSVSLRAGRDVLLSNNAQVSSATSGTGDAGSILLRAGRDVMLSSDAAIFNNVDDNAGTSGNPVQGGSITVEGQLLSLSGGAQMQVQVNDNAFGNGGRVIIRTNRLDMVGENGDRTGTAIFSSIAPSAVGEGGTIAVGLPVFDGRGNVIAVRPISQVRLRNGAQMLAQTDGQDANAGSVFVVANDISFDGIARVRVDGTLETRSSAAFTSVGDGAVGNGGFVLLSGGLRFNRQGDIIDIRPANSITLSGGAQLLAQTNGTGNAGTVFAVANRINLDGTGGGLQSGILAQVGENAQGNGGSILLGGRIRFDDQGNNLVQINPAQLISLRQGAQIRAEINTLNAGFTAGLVRLVGENIELSGTSRGFPSSIITRVAERSPGAGGNIFLLGGLNFNDQGNPVAIPSQSISLTGGAQLQAQTGGILDTSNAGNVLLSGQNITFSGLGYDASNDFYFPSGIFTRVESGARGRGGFIFVGGQFDLNDQAGTILGQPAQSITIREGAQLQAQTAGVGNAGNTYLFGDEIELEGFEEGLPSAIFSGVDGGTGQGGDILISGSGIASNQPFEPLSPVNRFSIGDGAVLSVSSFGLRSVGGTSTNVSPDRVAGNIFVYTRILDMNNERTNIGLGNDRGIFAETGEGNSGNIGLAIEELLLMQGSTRISTTAGTLERPGNGGNITILTDDEGFVIAEPFGNNDITSNSFEGAGGRVEITAQQIFGLFFRSSDDLKRLLGTNDPRELDTERLQSSDVTAISQTDSTLDGQVFINPEGVDPTQGLVELPTGVVDAADQIGQVCPTGPRAAERLGNFVVTGRGGIAPSPLEVLDGANITTDWLEESDRPPTSPTPTNTPEDSSDSSTLIEADGWVVGSNGEVQLVAQASGSPAIANPLTACPQ